MKRVLMQVVPLSHIDTLLKGRRTCHNSMWLLLKQKIVSDRSENVSMKSPKSHKQDGALEIIL